MRPFLKVIVRNVIGFLSSNRVVAGLIRTQHRHLPLPLPVFDRLFRHPIVAKMLEWYGVNVFLADYAKRSDNQSYWLSEDSLYWHLYRQTHIARDVLHDIADNAELCAVLARDDLVFLEPGFGLGKQTNALRQSGLLGEGPYHACDPNGSICDYVGQRYGKAYTVHQGSLKDITLWQLPFDVLVCWGGVFMYATPDEVEALFASLPARGCKHVMIFQEGHPDGDLVRHDSTTMYDFRRRLSALYPNAHFIETVRPADGLYNIFAMLSEPHSEQSS